MSDWVMGLALLCLAGIAGLALWVAPESGKEIAAAAVGAIGGALTTRALTPKTGAPPPIGNGGA